MRFVACVAILALSGCSIAMTRGPASGSAADNEPDCTSSMETPKTDVGIGGTVGLALILAGGFKKEGWLVEKNEDTGVTMILGGVLTIAVFYASATIGALRVKRCRKAIKDWKQRQPAAPSPSTGS